MTLPGDQAVPPRAGIATGLRLADRIALPAWLAVLLLVVSLVPMASVVEIDPDEAIGIEIARHLLDGRGQYTEIWNDQPPLHPTLLAIGVGAIGLVGGGAAGELLAGRLISLLFAMLLAAALYRELRRETSPVPALVGVLLLIFSYRFVRMAGAAMMGLPAVTMALAGCWFAVRSVDAAAPRRALAWAAAAGAVIACSWLTKPIVWFAPILAGLFVLFSSTAAGRWRPLAAMIGGFIAALLVVGTLTSAWNAFDQVLGTGWGDATREHFAEQDVATRVRYFAERDQALLVMGLLGVPWVAWTCLRLRPCPPDPSRRPPRSPARPRIPAGAMAFAWFLAAAMSIAYHRPIWWHHFLLLSVPLAWLAGYGAEAIWSAVLFGWHRGIGWRALGVVLAATLPLAVAAGAFNLSGDFVPAHEAGGRPLDDGAVKALREAPAGPVFVDRLIYATAARRAPAPWWTVITEKRLRSDTTMMNDLAPSLQESDIAAVLLARWEPDYLGDDFAAWLDGEFIEVYRSDDAAVYIRRE